MRFPRELPKPLSEREARLRLALRHLDFLLMRIARHGDPLKTLCTDIRTGVPPLTTLSFLLGCVAGCADQPGTGPQLQSALLAPLLRSFPRVCSIQIRYIVAY